MRHLLDFQDVNKNHLENLIEESRSLKIKSKNLDTLALLKFDEPSTRTRLSFAIAAEKLLNRQMLYQQNKKEKCFNTN